MLCKIKSSIFVFKYELLIRLIRMNSSQNNILLDLYKVPQTVFSVTGISLFSGEKEEKTLTKRLNYYVRNRRLVNPRRGFYAKEGYNPEELACMLYTPSYLSLEYVLQKAGVVFQYDSRYTLISYLSRTVEVDGNEFYYRRIKGDILVDMRGIECRGNINIATPERAFLDVMYLNAAYYFDNLQPLNYKKILELLPIYGNKRMEIRVKQLFDKNK